MESVALVMPVHNEAESIEETLNEIIGKILAKLVNVQIFAAEDGSSDGTREKLLSLQTRLTSAKLHVDTVPKRKGYPRAARDAILNIDKSYDYILFMDSDGQYNPNDFFPLWSERDKADFVIGSRIERAEPAYRKLLSRGLNHIVSMLFHSQTQDVTSAFRLMKTPIAQEVASQVRYSQHSFWSEFTARSAVLGVRAVEVPVSYRTRAGDSKVYSMGKMPKIVWDEFDALARTWLESKKKREQVKMGYP